MSVSKIVEWDEVGSMFQDGNSILFGGFMGVGTPARAGFSFSGKWHKKSDINW